MTDWKQYATEMAEAKKREEAFEQTLTPGELAEMDQLKAALHRAIGDWKPEEPE